MPVILAEAEIRRLRLKTSPGKMKNETLSQKYSAQKRAGGVDQVAECLPSKC
jgi:hypothetical protein